MDIVTLVLLALAACVYPTLLAGVILILARPRPLRMLLGFLAGGVTISLIAGIAIVRALEAAAVAHAGVSVRDAVGGAVVERLERAGVSPQAASSIAELLQECEAARFAPAAPDVVTARGRWLRAQGAIRSLERRA